MTETSIPEYDVAVLGGGPAGAAAATLLAGWGHSVTVLTRPGGAAGGLAESLPPSTIRLLDRIGASAAVERAAFVRSTGNTAWWGSEDARVELFPGGAFGYQVPRARLDSLLLELAAQSGARVRSKASVRSVNPGSGHSVVRFEEASAGGESRESEMRAQWVLDCTGRTGVVARHGFRRHEEGVNTLALVAAWRRPGGWSVPEWTHTLIESFRDGWAWSVPVSPELRFFTVMVDPRRTEMARGTDPAKLYAAELAKAERFSELLDGARMDVSPWACAASPYAATRYTDEGLLLVGDAGSFLDPITSFGVKKALASGWRAAVVAHTALARPDMSGPALKLFDTREKLVQSSYHDQSAGVFGAAGREHSHPFWSARSLGGASAGVDVDGELDVSHLRHDSAVLAAFERLRGEPSIDLETGPGVEFVSRPTIVGNEVVMERRLVTPGLPTGVRFVRDVDLVALTRLAPDCRQIPDLFDSYCTELTPVALPDFLGAVSLLVARGALVQKHGES